MILVLFLLLVPAEAVDFDTLTGYRCYTLNNRLSKKTLTCGVSVGEENNCAEYCQNKDTESYKETDKEDYEDAGVVIGSEQICSVSYKGRCDRNAGGIDDLCFSVVNDPTTYSQAIRNCENEGGHLFVPDNDDDLARIVKLINGTFNGFWIGGGTIFFRSCKRVKPNADGVEPAVTFTINDRRRGVLGYTKTRLASEKANYVCSMPSKSVEPSKCLHIDGTLDDPLIYDGCKMHKPTGNAVPGSMVFGCIPGGPLQIGDVLTFYATQPPNPSSWWSFNLFTSNFFVSFHCTVRESEGVLVYDYVNGPWGGKWLLGSPKWRPCPYSSGQLVKTTIRYYEDNLLITTADKFSFAFPHKIRDYAYFGTIYNVQNITRTKGDKIYGMPVFLNTTAAYWL